eukprot:CAMPEP_0177199262 /NCGR_PEP_ID=MMETSP0367-20130122/25580_1 /TAXON_ID=447022 ORGANISM="Scrippsiella hangoei-like, Strain SHHI-4" /NCGR_SAMPLE_ID=MMETSP0367 /ASSEMBLY_ACC=CAM_ASM_000362 /LENGTH=64 /DNA_ID=CAMNT_0018647599 /DNA_START=181 /DNA_END=375 /DNA_ORIENTATION=+
MSSPHLMMATTIAMKPSARATARCLAVKYSFGGALGRNGSIMAAAQKRRRAARLRQSWTGQLFA